MHKIHPGHEVLSLFGMPAQTQALNKKIVNRELVNSFIGAFFIILIVSLVLGLSAKTLPIGSGQPVVSAASTLETVAFQPGQFITNEINRGYLAK